MQPKTWVAQMSTEYSDITTETDVYQQNIPDQQRLRTNTDPSNTSRIKRI